MSHHLCWLRRDLRVHDNNALSKSLAKGAKTYVVFIFDENILKHLTLENDLRLPIIQSALKEIDQELKQHNSALIIRYGDPVEIIPQLVEELKISHLYFNRDYETYAKKRDEAVTKKLKHIECLAYKDTVFYEKDEVMNNAGEYYKVFTSYKKKWLEKFRNNESFVPHYKCQLSYAAPLPQKFKAVVIPKEIEQLSKIDNHEYSYAQAKKQIQQFKKIIAHYKTARDFPAQKGTSELSPYLRFGIVSLRELLTLASQSSDLGSQTWLSELIWREFYFMILDAFPHVEKSCYKKEYDNIKWAGEKKHFAVFCNGQTGFPIVDAAMRELKATGKMHNRLRMIVASFLTKTLLLNWQWGEKHFAELLLDFDLSANNGGWQWSASTGVDAQPYFRIFNPYKQSSTFDPDGEYIKIWCPELSALSKKYIHEPHLMPLSEQEKINFKLGRDYPAPIVDYSKQRFRALEMYKAAQKST